MSERRNMQIGDWFMAALNVLLGAVVGSIVDYVVQIFTTALWPFAVLIPLMLAGMWMFDRMSDWIFSIGVRPENKPAENARAAIPATEFAGGCRPWCCCIEARPGGYA
ncbi:hypothetical protein [Halomonas tibetensis]|uniref:Uncharacterized protein n=1 Tax=Halomonas tibetensis TaxID=2259590 RepID=A0ABV7B6F0_9GAMM